MAALTRAVRRFSFGAVITVPTSIRALSTNPTLFTPKEEGKGGSSPLPESALVPYLSPYALISTLGRQGFTYDEAKKITAIAMSVYAGLDIKTHSLFEKTEIHKADEALDSSIDECVREIRIEQKKYDTLLKRKIRNIWEELGEKMKPHIAEIDEMASEVRARLHSKPKAVEAEAFLLWFCGSLSIASAGIAITMLLVKGAAN